MTLPSLNDGERARASFVDFRLQLQRRIQPSAPAPLTPQEIQQETPFDADLVAQIPVLRYYAHSSLAIGGKPWIWCRIPARELCAFAISFGRGPVCALGF